MEKQKTPLESINKKNPFTVPEGYFDNLTNQIMVLLPEKQEVKKRNIWKKVSPWIYMAAMMTGIAFGFQLFINQQNTTVMKHGQHASVKQEQLNGRFGEAISTSEEDVMLSFVNDYELYEYLYEGKVEL